ncbi:putative reverse transcriptase domain-containing protein [Tanacetum coccineum]|uniref:Reverse transcriptase domain-containing protein n=1 Tax=Tanacetum coccineum TaxID=301880 RepID=A0ABQ5CTI2_9ASTR
MEAPQKTVDGHHRSTYGFDFDFQIMHPICFRFEYIMVENFKGIQAECCTGEFKPMFYNYLRPLTSLDEGLYALACEDDTSYLRAPRFRATLEEITDEPGSIAANKTEKILCKSDEKSFGVDDLDLNLNEPVNLNVSQVETQSELPVSEEPDVGRTQEPILVEVSTQEPIVTEVNTEVPIVEEVGTQEFSVEDVVLEDYSSKDAGTDDDDDDDVDKDFLVDEENEIVEPDVDVHLFGIGMDHPFDNIGVTNLKFTTPKEAKDRVYLHSIKSSRNLKLYKNDGVGIRARCDGKVLVFTMSQGTRPTGPNRGMEAGPSGSSGPTTRSKKGRIQVVKTHSDTHTCLQSREIKHRTYKFLSENIFEQARVNPDIPVKAVQDQLQHELEMKKYVCRSLKLGFRACRRDLSGLDGAFMKGPFPSQVLVAVGLDSNNGIYPLAYALVEAESKSSWCWFLQCLGDDIDSHPNLNFTFISDRQKGIISAIKTVYPSRAKSDLLLNNICEVFNGKIVGGKDKPVIKLLKYIREYCMNRIVNVQGVIDKCTGPLTPTAIRIMKFIKKEAHFMKVQWNGANKYQVSGSLGDQCVMNVVGMTCSCKKWELTMIPCKHAIAACWNMALNDHATPPPETTKYWEKSTCPRKKEKRSKHEDEPFVKDGKLSRKGRIITWQSCGNTRHNKATCKGQGGNNAEASGSASRHAQQTEPAIGQDGSGGSGVGAVIGLSVAASKGGAGGASQSLSHSRWTRRRVQTERISPQKRTPTQPASQPSTSSQVPVSETRNANGREMGDGIPTQSSATGGASEWQRERVVEFKEVPNREGGRVERNAEGGRPSKPRVNRSRSQGTNLPLLLAAHLRRNENGQPLQSSLTSIYGGHQPSTNIGGNLPLMDYPLLDVLKMPSHVGSYDGKGDPDNYLHLFEGAIRMQKWAMPVSCHMFTYTLKDSTRIWWNSQKADSILNYEELKAKFWSHFSQQKKFTKTHPTVHNIKQREGESTKAFVTRYTDNTLQILGLHEDQRISGFVHGLRTRNLVEFLSTYLLTTYKGLMEKTYTCIEAREVATNGAPNDQREGFDRSKKNSPWDNNREKKDRSRHQIKEAVKSGQLSHLLKGIKKGKVKVPHTQRGYGKKEKDTTPVEAPILMISRREPAARRVSAEEPMSHRVDSKVPLVGFSGEHSCPIGEVLLETTIGDATFTRTKTLNFVIVRSTSPYNLLLGRTTMQKMGIVVFMIHGAIKFYTPRGIGTVLSTCESDKEGERSKRLKEVSLRETEEIFSCADAEERVIVNDKYPEQMVIVGRQLPANFKENLQNLLRSNADVFAWTHAYMTGIPRTIMIRGKPLNTEHKLNEYKHIKLIKQKRRGLGSDHSAAACKEVDELMKAGIL